MGMFSKFIFDKEERGEIDTVMGRIEKMTHGLPLGQFQKRLSHLIEQFVYFCCGQGVF